MRHRPTEVYSGNVLAGTSASPVSSTPFVGSHLINYSLGMASPCVVPLTSLTTVNPTSPHPPPFGEKRMGTEADDDGVRSRF